MQFKDTFLTGIRDGSITVTFRRWRSPRVRVCGTYRVRPDLVIAVRSIAQVSAGSITTADARRSGFRSKEELIEVLRKPGSLYRVAFERAPATPSPLISLANAPLTAAEKTSLAAKLSAMDARTASGAWTARTLELINAHPGRRAGDLAPLLTLETPVFKTRVRRLKALGLTESLETGYRLTARGRALNTRSRS